MDRFLKKMGLSRDSERIEISPNLDFSALVLTPEEAFLLSRIDAAQSLQEVFQVSTFPKAVTLEMLERFAEQKIIQPVQKPAIHPAAEIAKKKSPLTQDRRPKESVSGLAEDYCLAIEDQFERLQNQNLSHAQILEVSEKAGLAVVKKAYFQLTKKFHPDRVFRKDSGIYAQRVEFIFRRLNQAMEEIEKSKKPLAKPVEAKSKTSATVKVPSPIMDRMIRAREMLKEARSIASKDPVAAANTLRLASTFDPSNKEIKQLLTEVEGRANFRKAIKYYEEAQKFEDILAYEKAAEAYEKATSGDPKNAQYQRVFGEFLLYKMKDPKRALAYSEKACALDPNSVENHMLHAFSLKALQRYQEAKSEYERVLQLDKSNLFAKNELAQLLTLSFSKK